MRTQWVRPVVVSLVSFWLAHEACALPSVNLPSSFADTKAKLASGQQADILILGDSLSFRAGSYLPYFRDEMQRFYGNAGSGYQSFSAFTGADLGAGWTVGQIGTDTSPHYALDGLWGSTAAQSYGSLPVTDERVELHYVTQPNGGSFRPTAGPNGAPLGPEISTAVQGYGVQSWGFDAANSPGLSKITYQTTGTGNVTLLGQNNINSNPGVRIHRAANGGWTALNFAQRNTTFDRQVQLLHPDLVMVFVGANDLPRSVTEYTNNLNALISRIWIDMPSAEVVLITPHDFTPEPVIDDPLRTKIAAANESIAATRGVGVINLYEVAGNSDFWLGSNLLDDQIHYSPLGGQYIANLLFEAFVTDGLGPRWSGQVRPPVGPIDDPTIFVVPEPSSGLLAVVGLLAIRRTRFNRSDC